MGPVGCCPFNSNTKKSSTCRDGGRLVFGGRVLNGSGRVKAPRLKRWVLRLICPPLLKVEIILLLYRALVSRADFLIFFFRYSWRLDSLHTSILSWRRFKSTRYLEDRSNKSICCLSSSKPENKNFKLFKISIKINCLWTQFKLFINSILFVYELRLNWIGTQFYLFGTQYFIFITNVLVEFSCIYVSEFISHSKTWIL